MEKAKYDVLEVSRHIINYSNRMGYGVSNLKLQKLLYFVQAYFVAFTESGAPCFKEKIEAWDFGPVVPEAYHEFKIYGGCNIPVIDSYFDFKEDGNPFLFEKKEFVDNKISLDDKKIIDGVVDQMAEYSATTLVNITHNQSPWCDAYVPHMNNEITLNSIRSYFNANR